MISIALDSSDLTALDFSGALTFNSAISLAEVEVLCLHSRQRLTTAIDIERTLCLIIPDQEENKPRNQEMAGGTKRDYDGNARAKNAQGVPRGRFHAMFENFRDELDEHYDRRERIIKASRDVTAQSKKMFVFRE